MANSLQLVRPQADKDTVETLQGLLQAAQEGRLTGLAYVALHPGGGYSGDTAGSAKDNPHATVGLLRALEGKITPDL